MVEENEDATPGTGRHEWVVARDGGDVVEIDDVLRGDERGDATIEVAATEKSEETTEVSMNVGRDGPESDDHEGPDRSTEEGIDLESVLPDAVDEEGDILERTAGTTDHAVGEGAPDDLFEEFEEDTPEEVIRAVDESVESKESVDVAGLFEDLDEVEASTVSTHPPEHDATEATLPVGTDETADEVEGLLDDLTTVDIETTDTSGAGTAHTEPTILSTEETRATGFNWLGEDIRVFPSDGDPGAVLEAFEADSPRDVIRATGVAVTATEVFDGLAGGRVTHPGTGVAPLDDGWSADGTTTAGVGATALFEHLAASVDAPTTVSTGTDTATTARADAPDLDRGVDDASTADGRGRDADRRTETVGVDVVEETEGRPEFESTAVDKPMLDETGADDRDAEVAGLTDTTPDGAVAAESDVDALFERFDEESPEEVIAAETESDPDPTPGEAIEPSAERIDDLFGDLSTVRLASDGGGERDTAGEGETTETLDPGSDETAAAVEGLLGDVSPADVPEAVPEDDADDDTEPTFTAETERITLGDDAAPDELERTSEDTHVAVGESDIDALFERFNESGPEEVAESARVPPLEELGERDPEQVRETVGGDADRTPGVDDDPVEVLGPDDDEESLSGTIREDLGADTDWVTDRERHDGDGELADLTPDDIFEDASGRDHEATTERRSTAGGAERDASGATEDETDPVGDTPRAETKASETTTNGRDGVASETENAGSDPSTGDETDEQSIVGRILSLLRSFF